MVIGDTQIVGQDGQFLLLCLTCRERTIHLSADTTRFDSMQKNIGRYDTDTIRLLNCLLC